MSAKTQRGEVQREKILKAGKHLFARQGFGSTGVRQIAETAGVNPAMVNYYFGSKQGLLKAVLAQYFDAVVPRALAAFAREQSVRDTVREVVAAFTDIFRNDLELIRVLVAQLPLESEDTVFPQDRLAVVLKLVQQQMMPRLEQEMGRKVPLQILMPAVMGLVMGHFVSRPAFENILGVRCDDAFYQRFPDLVVGIVFDGFRGAEAIEDLVVIKEQV